MAKIWKVTFKHVYGPQNQYSYTDTKFYYTEKEMLRILKSLPILMERLKCLKRLKS